MRHKRYPLPLAGEGKGGGNLIPLRLLTLPFSPRGEGACVWRKIRLHYLAFIYYRSFGD